MTKLGVLMVKIFVRMAVSVMLIGLIFGLIYYMVQPQLQIISDQNNQVPLTEPDPAPNEQELLQPVNIKDPIYYSLQNEEINISFDKGKEWIKVPVQKDLLFGGEYNGNKQELIPDSFILSDTRVAFLYTDGVNWDRQRILITYSVDYGRTWKESVVVENFSGIRFRKVVFLNDQFGYIIASGGRTMSQESSHVFLSYDGGESWTETNNSGITRLISDGGFINEWTGFLSFGTINPESPDFYMTEDAGNTWVKSEIRIPSNYQKIFVTAEIPTWEGNQLTLLVNQGPNGDYKGGKVKGKFLSSDNGRAWEFQKEVEPSAKE
jgi:hypothetical protein